MSRKYFITALGLLLATGHFAQNANASDDGLFTNAKAASHFGRRLFANIFVKPSLAEIQNALQYASPHRKRDSSATAKSRAVKTFGS